MRGRRRNRGEKDEERGGNLQTRGGKDMTGRDKGRKVHQGMDKRRKGSSKMR